MARYRKVETAVWADERFRSMTSAAPNGQTLWLYLLCGPRTTTFPGLVVAREAVIADDLGWTVEGLRQAFAEASAKGLAKADWKAGLVVLKKALLDGSGEPRETSRPESPNVLKSWAKSWDEIPDCELKTEYLRQLGAFSVALGGTFQQAFQQAFRKALAKGSLDPSPNQDQEQNQEQEREKATLSLVPSEPDPRALRRALADAAVHQLNKARRHVAARHGLSGVIDLPSQTRDAIQLRLAEEPELDAAARQLENALACLEAEADELRSVEHLAAKSFEPRPWQALVSTTPEAARERVRRRASQTNRGSQEPTRRRNVLNRGSS